MAISLLDINAGDTIQSMVQKINYNFDQIQANGGGPQGEQGIQGIQGATGERGETGEQGIRGSRWYTVVNNAATSPDPEVFPPQNNDMGIDGNGNVYIYQTESGTWTQTGMSITEVATSAFVGGGYDSIEANENYTDYKLILGTTSGQMSENIGTNPSLAININTQEGATAHTDGLEFYTDGISNNDLTGRISVLPEGNESVLLHINAKNGVKITSNVGSNDNENSIILESNTKKIKFSAFENVAPEDISMGDDMTFSINPLVLVNHDGEIITGKYSNHSYDYDWCIETITVPATGDKLTSLRPNVDGITSAAVLGDTYNDNHVHPLTGIHLRGVSSISDYSTPYITAHAGDSSRYDMYVKCMRNGSAARPTIGLYGNQLVAGYASLNPSSDIIMNGTNVPEPMRKGITITEEDGNGFFGGMLCFKSNPTADNTLLGKITNPNFNPSQSIATLNQSIADVYRNYIYRGSEYGCGSVITAKSNNINKIYDQISIKGAYADENKPAGSVLVSGGRGYSSKRGGDVYISGGDNLTGKPTYSSLGIVYNEFMFGDVVIGVNPDNHRDYYHAYSNDDNPTNRGINDYKYIADSPIPFYDINNFTAHANNIWLDSDAQHRMLAPNDYSMSEYPTITNPKLTTFNISGLCTLHHGKQIVLRDEDMYRHQMLSGKMCFISVHSKKRPPHTSQDYYYVDAFDRAVSLNLLPTDSLISLYETEWIKMGNLVQCHTKITNYRRTSNSYLIIYNGMKETTIQQYPIPLITTIPLPIVTAANNGITDNVNCINGNGIIFTESETSSEVDLVRTFDKGVTNAIFEHSEFYVTRPANFVTPRHNGNGVVTIDYPLGTFSNGGTLVQANRYPQDYARGFKPADSSITTYAAMLAYLGSDVIYAIPSYMYEYDTDNHEFKSIPMDKLYTTATFNFSYMINSEFKTTNHTPFFAQPEGEPYPTSDEIGATIASWNEFAIK